MEEFFLRTFFADNKLNIINEQNIIIPVFFPEFRSGDVVLVADGIDMVKSIDK